MMITKGTTKSNLKLTGILTACCLSLGMSMPLPFNFVQGQTVWLGLPAQAAIGSDVRLSQLETKFFKHTYPKDEEAVRLERLEKMIFGESRTGSSEERLKNLAATVPNLAETASEAGDSGSSSGSSAAPSNDSGSKPQRSRRNVNNADSDLDLTEERTKNNRPGGQVLSGESKYPAVTALEQNLFKRDYASEPVGDRLNRLESKVFGKPSKFTDMSERVDALKEKTNIDIAKKAPPGTDWVDEEDDDVSFPGPRAKAGGTTPFTKNDGYGRTTSGGGYGTTGSSASSGVASGASGSYGMGGGSSGNTASGAYGMGGMSSASTVSSAAPRRPLKPSSRASDRFDDDEPTTPAVGAIGLSSQVAALENAVLGKTFSQDPLINRVSRLEETVFPNKTDSAASMSLPERVSKLVAKVPVAAAPPKTARANRRSLDMDMDDDMDMGTGSGLSSLMGGGGALGSSSMGSGMTVSQSTQTRGTGGLGRIINSIGNMLGGGYVGSYGMAGGGGMVRDPSTGMLVDTLSGNLINPSTGQIVGRSTGYPSQVYTNGITQYGGGYGTGIGGLPMGMGGMGMGMGTGYGYPGAIPAIPPLGGYTGFNNGFSPYGYPAGGYGMNGMGGMGSGIRFGGSNFGVRF